ncbi:MAG TPA: M13 family metallopeptidase [Gemmatimonadaceae bacterium]|jgi:putative endopeptidase|nr:M13 family metallopeptidase [Gemmatimonadaceae bacterium]
MRASLTRLAAAAALAVLPSFAGAQQRTPIFNKADMDTTCAACSDFYEYANGGWLKSHQNAIPADRTSISSFSSLSEHNTDVAHGIMQDDSAAVKAGKAKAGTEQWKIGTYYTACMDTAAIDALGTRPIQSTLQKVDAINSSADLVRSFAELRGGAGGGRGGGGMTPFGVRPGADPKNSNETIVSAGPGGLGLPEREYYFRTDARSANIRDQYVAHITRSLELAGESDTQAKSDAGKAMALETALARITATRAQMRDPNASYHKMTIGEFSAMTPHVNWRTYIDAVGGADAGAASMINVTQPNYFKGLDSLIANTPVDEWKAYLRWHAVSSAATRLGSSFANEDFQFQKVMSGVEQPQPRWRACYGATNGALGWAVGHEYIARTFTPADRERARKMVENLVSALHDRIQTLDWMSAATKQQATTKLDAYLRKVAYPDKWTEYTALEVKPGQYYENGVLDAAWNQNRAWKRVGKPVDKTEWSMTPPTVNASYSPSLNQIQFPAGILAPPFFDPNADDAVNYGGLGAVIGHEMSHGFDDQGRQFDAKGNLRDWWTAEDAAKYKQNAQKMIDEYNGFTVIDSTTHVNGQATLGENIGDFGGLTVAYAAMEKALDAKGPSARRKIDGFTPEQRFFLSWARVWREVQRPEAERLQVNTNPHSPGKWRVNGPLSIMPEFAKAWGCKEGDAMVRPENQRARIW